jgi:hypothetical protein
MAKFYGPVGYAETVETAPGVYVEKITERMYFGDLTRNTRRLQSSETLNDDINVANEISIVADPFANQNFHRMRYVGFMGANWKISNVEVHYPRLILTIGVLQTKVNRKNEKSSAKFTRPKKGITKQAGEESHRQPG